MGNAATGRARRLDGGSGSHGGPGWYGGDGAGRRLVHQSGSNTTVVANTSIANNTAAAGGGGEGGYGTVRSGQPGSPGYTWDPDISGTPFDFSAIATPDELVAAMNYANQSGGPTTITLERLIPSSISRRRTTPPMGPTPCRSSRATSPSSATATPSSEPARRRFVCSTWPAAAR